MSTADEALRRPNWLRIDLGALRANYEALVRRAGDRRVVAAVKADAYGHGALEVSCALVDAGCDSLWTGHIGEALTIRALGLEAEVVLFGGYTPDQIPTLVGAGLVPTVVDLTGASLAASVGASVYVKVDAGLGRLGVPVAAAHRVIGEMAAMPGLTIAGIYTHLPFGDDAGREWAVNKGAVFSELLDGLDRDGIRPPFTQMWGSSGLLAGLPDATSAVCVGHALYGVSPFRDPLPTEAGLTPVLTEIGSRLIHVGEHSAEVGAGGYLSRGATRVGVIPFGVADGLPRARAGHALVRGRRVPLLGTSLEHSALDLSAVDDARVGDEVLLVGCDGSERMTPTEWASALGCGEVDALLGLAGRVVRLTERRR